MRNEVDNPRFTGEVELTFKIYPGPLHDEVTIEHLDDGTRKRKIVKHGQLCLYTVHVRA